MAKQNQKKSTEYKWKKGERSIFKIRQKRFQQMFKKKQKLGIDAKCDRMDVLYTPHLTSLEGQEQVKIQTSQEFQSDTILLDKARRSMPLAFEKITTAQAVMVKENPRGVMHAFQDKFKKNNIFIENVYYENFAVMKKKAVMQKYAYHLAKYGIGYWREYIKKTYRKDHEDKINPDQTVTLETKWVYDVFDQVAENLHPKNVILDDNCLSVKDVNRPANDLIIMEELTMNEVYAKYPMDKFENVRYVEGSSTRMIDVKNTETDEEGKVKNQVLIYENRYENLRETWINGIPIESIPLPGNELSVSGDKWCEDRENYDGIGVGQIIEIYLPIIDDITNASMERLRQIVRPNEDWFNGVDLADESDDSSYGSGNVRKFTGPIDQIKYSQPPARTDAEAKEKEEILEEIDRATMTPRNMAGVDDAKTAYQSAQNREAALQKLSLPLGAIKKTIEDAANLSIALFPIVYGEPLETNILKPGDDDFDEALAIVQQANELGINDERVAVMNQDKEGNPVSLARRKFREMELPITVKAPEEGQGNETTGRLVATDERSFWEALPENFNWRGRIEILGESFLPVSKALDDEQNKETIEYLMQIQVKDELGNPTLTDGNGVPYTIDKVRLAKDRAAMNRNFDPDRYIVPMNMDNQQQGVMNPLDQASDVTPKKMMGMDKAIVPKVQLGQTGSK